MVVMPSISEDRLDACVFKCQECWQFETTSRAQFSHHLGSHHKMSEAQFWVHDFYSITMFILGGISIFQDAYGTLIFVKSRLRCQDCGGYVLHAKEELDAHLKVRA